MEKEEEGKKIIVVDDDDDGEEEKDKTCEKTMEDDEEKIIYLDKCKEPEGFFESVFNDMKETLLNYKENNNDLNDKIEKNDKEDFEVIDKKKEAGDWEILG